MVPNWYNQVVNKGSTSGHPVVTNWSQNVYQKVTNQGGITCGAIDEPRKSSKAIDKRVIIDFRDKNVVIARFRDKNEVFI